MRVVIDTDQGEMLVSSANQDQKLALYSTEAFEALSRLWTKVGWNQKYPYTFSWLGRPIIQLPEDMLRMQEIVWNLKPDVIIETGVAHGGSLMLFASLCKVIGKGRVVGIDIEIRRHNRLAIEAHPLSDLITLIEGSSIAPEVVAAARAQIPPGGVVLVVLDSNHSYAHVRAELEAYSPLVSVGSYIVATDGIMEDLHDVPRGSARWTEDNPARAARDFAASRRDLVLEPPSRSFNESELRDTPTHWPDAWLRRVSPR
jgi:cephalosporin hydroxylase